MSEDPIYIDVGNTALKAVDKPNTDSWHIITRCSWSDRNQLEKLVNVSNRRDWIIGSVRNDWEAYLKHQARAAGATTHFVTIKDFPKEILDYETPHSLGVDRILAGLGAWSQIKKDVIVLDAGTACTIDYVTADGIYQGGVIAPGLPIIKAGFATQTPELPTISDRVLPDQWPGKSTDQSMRWGIIGSFKEMLLGHLRHYLEASGEHASIVITGGDASLVKNLISSDMMVTVDDFLVFRGLEYGYKKGWFIAD